MNHFPAFLSACLIAIFAVMNAPAARGEETPATPAIQPTVPPAGEAAVGQPDGKAAEAERAAVEQTLKKALEQSQAEKADLEKRLAGAAERERQAREQAERLAAEKAVLEKGCPPQSGEKGVDGAGKTEVRKKAPHRKKAVRRAPVADRESIESAAAEGGAPVKKPGKRAKKKRTSGSGKAATASVKASGPRLTMKQVKKLLSTTRDFSGKNLSGLNLTGLDFTGANLKGADLAGANLERADFQESNLERADISGANLRSASLRLANINAAKLDGAVLDGGIWSDGRTCPAGSIGVCRE